MAGSWLALAEAPPPSYRAKKFRCHRHCAYKVKAPVLLFHTGCKSCCDMTACRRGGSGMPRVLRTKYRTGSGGEQPGVRRSALFRLSPKLLAPRCVLANQSGTSLANLALILALECLLASVQIAQIQARLHVDATLSLIKRRLIFDAQPRSQADSLLVMIDACCECRKRGRGRRETRYGGSWMFWCCWWSSFGVDKVRRGGERAAVAKAALSDVLSCNDQHLRRRLRDNITPWTATSP